VKIQFRSADEIGLRYIELGEPMGATRAINPVAIEGEFCSHCGGGPSTVKSRVHIAHPVDGREKHWRRVCVDCDRAWEPGERVAVLRSEITIPTRRDGLEACLVRAADEWSRIRRIVEDRPHRLKVERRTLTLAGREWDFNVISWLVYLRGDVGSVARVVEIGRELRPQFGIWWSPGKVRRAIATAQAVVEARARRDRLISPRCVA